MNIHGSQDHPFQQPSLKVTELTPTNFRSAAHPNNLLPNLSQDLSPQASLRSQEVNIHAGNPALYNDARSVSDDQLRALLCSPKPLRFDWENKWLRGDQYAHMLNNIDAYCAAFHMAKLGEKQHPENIYTLPQSKSLLHPLR